MKCVNCGSAIPADASFCPKCGAKSGAAKLEESAREGSPTDMLRPRHGGPDVEERLWEGGYSAKAMVGSWVLAGLVTIGLIVASVLFREFALILVGIIAVIWLLLGLTLFFRKLNIHYELTSQRFIHRRGILTRSTDRIEVIDVDDVTFEQGIVQRMLGVGSIKISSSDRTHPELILIGIDDVKTVADLIDNARRQERRKRGLHIESV